MLMLGMALLDHTMPTLQLRPLAYIFVIAITAVAGYGWGLVSGVLAAASFTAAETSAGYRSTPEALVWNVLIVAVSLAVTVSLVEIIRHRTISAEAARAELARAQEELEDVKRLHDAQAALQLAEQRYAAIGESLPYGTWELSADGTQLVHVSDNFCRLLGMTPEEIANGGWRKRVPPQDAERFLAVWNERDKTDVFEGEYRVVGIDGNTYWILSRGVRLVGPTGRPAGWAGFNLDITERKRSELRLTLLSDLGRVLSLSLEPMATVDRAARLLVPRIADWCTFDLLATDQTVNRVLIFHHDAALTQAARGLASEQSNSLLAGPTSARVIATRKPQLKQRVSAADGKSDEVAAHQQRDVETAFAPVSLIVVPLIARDQTLGALTLATSDSERRYAQDDLDFASIIARRIALALDNALLYERERRVADIFQRASLPATLPVIPGIAIHAHYQPDARESEIGGDWYDAFQLSDGRVGISIGDVAGKGLQAASIMSTVRLFIRATALEDLTPSRVLARANQLLLNEKPSMVTAIFGILDPEALTFTCSVAGHPLPIVANADGEISTALPVAPPLGISADTTFPEQTLNLPLGSLLVLYTDGLVESKRDKLQGEEALTQAVQSVIAAHPPNPAEAIASHLVDTSPSDDVAVLTVGLAAQPLLELDLTLPAQPVNGRIFRQALRRFYLAAGLSDDKIQLLQVALGEAITNSIQHAYGVRGGAVRVQGRIESGRLVVDICDSGRWRGPHDDGGGYGLQILKSIVQDVSISADDSGTTIRLTQPIGRVLT